MSQMKLTDAVAKLNTLNANDLSWVYKRATGQKPPKAAKKQTVLDALIDAFREKSAGDGDAAVVSDEAAGWLGEVGESEGQKPDPKPVAVPEPAAEPSRVTLEQAVTVLNSLGTKRMAAVHEQVVGKPGRGMKKVVMFKSIAAELQKRADGKGASATLADADVAWMAGAKDAKQGSEERRSDERAAAKKPRDPRLPAVGTVITKVWRDRTLEVQVNEDDMTFEGRTYSTLSRLSSELLGCPSNGFLFFGLSDLAKAATAKREAKAAAKLAAAEEKAKEQEQVIEKPEKPAKAKKTTKKSKAAKKTTKG